MGLAGPRKKQRISADPRNLAWSNDENKIGLKLMKSMGWTPGKGLGANESGQVEHLKMSLKDDKFGIGAKDDVNGVWMRNSNDYGALLERMNKQQGTATSSNETTHVLEGKGTEEAAISKQERKKRRKEKDTKKKSKKRKVDSSVDDEVDKPTKKFKDSGKDKKAKTKKSKADRKSSKDEDSKIKKDKKKRRDGDKSTELVKVQQEEVSCSSEVSVSIRNPARRKYLLAKRSATMSVTHLNEILGVTSTSNTGTSTPASSIPQTPMPTNFDEASPRVGLGFNSVNTSGNISLGDQGGLQLMTEKVSTEEYFQRRLAALAERDRSSKIRHRY